MTNRLFIALKLPGDILNEIILLREDAWKDKEKIRWEPREKLHLTLKFLGNVDEKRTNEIIDAFEKSISGFRKIECSYGKFGFFLPRILWLSLTADNQMPEIVNNIENNFEKLGFERENRPYNPHITLLRIKEKLEQDFISSFKNYKLPTHKFYISEAALIESKLNPKGSIYTDIKKIILL